MMKSNQVPNMNHESTNNKNVQSLYILIIGPFTKHIYYSIGTILYKMYA